MTADPPGHIYLSIKQQSGFRRSSERRMVDLKAPLLLHFGAFVGEVLCLGCHRVSSLDMTPNSVFEQKFHKQASTCGNVSEEGSYHLPEFSDIYQVFALKHPK